MDEQQKVVKVGSEARESIRRVLKLVGATVSRTLGPSGRNALIDRGRNDRAPLITNDGKTILKSTRLRGKIRVGEEDIEFGEAEDKVLSTIYEIAKRTDETAGDGTTTATTLGVAITTKALEKIPETTISVPGGDMNDPMSLARQIEEEKNFAVKAIQEMAEPVDTLEKLEDIAFTSLENMEAAKIVAQTCWDVGEDGFVTLEEGFEGRVESEVVHGIQIYAKVASSYFYTNDRRQSILERVPVLVTNATFANLAPLEKLFEDMRNHEEGRKLTSIVIMASKFEASAIRQIAHIFEESLSKTKGVQGFKILAVKVPSLTDEELEDVAAYLDATFINMDSKAAGKKLDRARFSDLGFAEKIVAGDDQTVLIGGRGTAVQVMEEGREPETRIEARLRSLRETAKIEHDEIFANKLQRRIEILAGGVGVIRVGAPTDTEKAYLKLKIEDAKNACKAALQEGMVPGGGVALLKVAEQLGEDALLYEPLRAPYEWIQRNTGGKFEIPDDVRDPAKVTRCALENAVSVAKILITTETIIADKEPSLSDELKEMLAK